jgi:hypothetical protein
LLDPETSTDPLSAEERRRVELTVSCRDTDPIPKVPGAGEIRIENGIRVQVMHEGTRVLAGGYFGDWMSEIIRRLRGHHEPQEELVVHRILKRLRGGPEGQPAVGGQPVCYDRKLIHTRRLGIRPPSAS